MDTAIDISAEKYKGKGIAVLVGVNSLDPKIFGPPIETNDPTIPNRLLHGCEEGVLKLAGFLKDKCGFLDANIKTLTGLGATKDAVKNELRNAIQSAQTQDIIVFYFAGHGALMPTNPHEPGADENPDQGIFCYNGPLKDDFLSEIWYGIERPLRVLALTDTCHSGTILFKDSKIDPVFRLRLDQLGSFIIHIASCRDTQCSYSTKVIGPFFTKALDEVCNSRRFLEEEKYSYSDFYAQLEDVVKRLVKENPYLDPLPADVTPGQTVQCHEYAPERHKHSKEIMDLFSGQKPFTVNPPNQMIDLIMDLSVGYTSPFSQPAAALVAKSNAEATAQPSEDVEINSRNLTL